MNKSIFVASLGMAFVLGMAVPDNSELVKYKPTFASNSCLVNAIGFQDALETYEVLHEKHWSKMLVMKVRDKGNHAVLVYEWKNTIFAYTAEVGSVALSGDMATKYDPLRLAATLCVYAGWVCDGAFFAQ